MLLARKKHQLHGVMTNNYESNMKNLIKTTSQDDLEYRKLLEQFYNRSEMGVANEFQVNAEGFL